MPIELAHRSVDFALVLQPLILKVRLLLGINQRLAREQINIRGLDDLGLLEDLVSQVEDDEERDAEVRGDEGLVVEAAVGFRHGEEDGETAEDHDDDAEDE